MTVQANWHLGDLDLTGAATDIMQLKSNANVIDLSRGVPEISAELQKLTDREGVLATKLSPAVECDLKWQPHHRLQGGQGLSCFSCPHYTKDPNEDRSMVCEIGRGQEDLIEELEAVRAADGLDRELAEALGRDIDACEELAEAALATA